MKGLMNISLLFLLVLKLVGCQTKDLPPVVEENSSLIVWKRAFEKTDLSSSPMYFNNTVIIGHPSMNEVYKVYAFNIKTGDTVWQQTIDMLGRFEPNFKDEVFICGDKVILSEAHDLCVLSARTGGILWYKTKEGLDSRCCEIDGYLYRTDALNRTSSNLYRFDINSGTEEKLFTINRSVYGSNYSPGLLMPVKWIHPSGDEILVLQNRTFGWFTDKEAKMDILAWNLTADSMLWYRERLDGFSSTARPAIDGDKVYFYGDHHTYCINPLNGKTVWKYFIGDGPEDDFNTANILVIDNMMIVKPDSRHMHAVNKETGERIWFNENTRAGPGLLTVHQDTIWFSSGWISAIDAYTGEKLIEWDNDHRGSWIFPVAHHPDNGHIYTSDASYLYCLDPKYMK